MEDQIYKAQDFTKEKLPKGTYDNCQFISCNFSGADLSEVNFVECSFEQSDLSTANITNTAFKEVHFLNCKLLGLRFDECNPFLLSLDFEECQLDLSNFYQLDLKGTAFKKCSLVEVDFSEANLGATSFVDTNLAGATFDQTNLEKADLSTAVNYQLNPARNRIRKARFSKAGLIGLLREFEIEIV